MSYHIGDVKLLRLQFYAIFNYEKVDPKDNLAFFRIIHREQMQNADTVDIPWTQMTRTGLGLYMYELTLDSHIFRQHIAYLIEYQGTYADDLSIGYSTEEFEVEDERAMIEDYLMYAKTCGISGRKCCGG